MAATFTSRVVSILDTDELARAARQCGIAVSINGEDVVVAMTEKANAMLTPQAAQAWVAFTYCATMLTAETGVYDRKAIVKSVKEMWSKVTTKLSREDIISIEACAMKHAFSKDERLSAAQAAFSIAWVMGDFRLKVWAFTHAFRSGWNVAKMAR